MSEAPEQTIDPRYPIGKWKRPDSIDAVSREQSLQELGGLPQNLRQALKHLDDEELDTPYRDGGWTVRQVVHHIADSHMNMSVRVRLALTEDTPTIKPYEEGEWANLHDALDGPVEWSVEIVEALHARLLMLFRSLTPEQWQRRMVHPAMGELTVETVADLYAWHSRHHVAHITTLRTQQSW